MSFLEVIEKNHEKEMWNIHLLGDDKHPLDYGNAVVFAGIIAVNAIMSKHGCQTVHLKSLLDTSIMHHIDNPDYPKTLEEFVSMTNEFAHLDYTNIMKKFKSVLSDNDIDTTHLAEEAANTSNEDLTKIKNVLEEDVESLINVVLRLDIDDVHCAEFPLNTFSGNQVNDAMHYAKDAMINVIKDAAKDIWDIITGQNQINLMPKLPNPEAFVIQQLPQPLVAQQSVFTPVPNYTGNKDIMKHFVIGNNVVIYDPNQQQMFEKDLVDLSKALDKVDKELGLKEPSKYGFDTFFDTFNFRATRLNKENKFVQPQDISNYIAVTRDQVNGYFITKPDKKPVQQQGAKDNKK